MAMAWLLGILQSAFSFVGFDIIYHISEEMPNPRREGPKIVNLTIIIGGFSGLLVLLAMLFSVSDVDELLLTPLRCVGPRSEHAFRSLSPDFPTLNYVWMRLDPKPPRRFSYSFQHCS